MPQKKNLKRICESKILQKYAENKKAWVALNAHFSNKLWFEQKLYCYRPGLITFLSGHSDIVTILESHHLRYRYDIADML